MACADIAGPPVNADAILDGNVELNFSVIGPDVCQPTVSQVTGEPSSKLTGISVPQEKLNTPSIYDELSDSEPENRETSKEGRQANDDETGRAASSSSDESDGDSVASSKKPESGKHLSDSEPEMKQSSDHFEDKIKVAKTLACGEQNIGRKRLANLSDSEPEEANTSSAAEAEPGKNVNSHKITNSVAENRSCLSKKKQNYPTASTSKSGLESLFEANMTVGNKGNVEDFLYISKWARKRLGLEACSHPHCRFSSEELTRNEDDFLPCPKTGEQGYTASEKLRRQEIGRSFKQNFMRSELHHLDKTREPSKVKVVLVSDPEIDTLGEVYGAMEVAQKDWQGQTPCNIAPNIGSLTAASLRPLTDKSGGCSSCREYEVNLKKSKFAVEELEKELEFQVKQNENMHDNALELMDLKRTLATQEKTIETLKKIAKRSRPSNLPDETQAEPNKTPAKKRKLETFSKFKYVDFRSKIFDNETWDGIPAILGIKDYIVEYPNERPPMLDSLAIDLSKYLPTDEDVKNTDEYFYVCYGCGFTCVMAKWRYHTRKSPQCAGQWRGRRKNTSVWTLESEKKLAKKCGKTNISNATEGYTPETPSEWN
ncbi:hypothetical protein HDE_00944 [Halotydeus destructor]|nr:hypothetical protein HDE_00944 [Halotydeus destructor]